MTPEHRKILEDIYAEGALSMRAMKRTKANIYDEIPWDKEIAWTITIEHANAIAPIIGKELIK